MSRTSTKATGKPRQAKRSGHRSDRSESTLEIIEGLLERRISISVNGEPTRASALQAIMFQLLQRASAGNGRAMRTYQGIRRPTVDQIDRVAVRRRSRWSPRRIGLKGTP